MQIDFTSEQEAGLLQIAQHSGTEPEELVKEAALRLLQDDAHFRASVAEGIAAADRGDFVEHEDVWAEVERILKA